MKRLFHKTHCSKRNEANRREVEGQNNKARPLVVERRTRSSTLGALTLLLGLLILLGSTGPVAAQSGDEVTDVRVEHTFGEQINFLARIQSPLSIKNATVTFQTVGGISQTQPLTVNPDGTAGYRYDASLNALPPFVQIIFWFDVTLDDGTHFTSSSYDFTYTDNRFPWQQRDDGLLRVHWYDGDSTFGNAVLNAAQRGLDAALALVPIASTGPIDVYVYANTADLHGALVLGGQSWVDGYASPELSVAMISITPGSEQSVALERQVPHELTHVLLYQSIGLNYSRLPVWLTEGLATNAELDPDPDLDTVLAAAVRSNSLLPLADLCDSFPPDTGRAILAYAESRSFVRFLLNSYGTSGVSALISDYADGMSCEEGARHALEQPLSQLEVRWRESALGENRSGVIATNLFPYLLMLGLVLLVPVWGAINRLIERRKNAQGQ